MEEDLNFLRVKKIIFFIFLSLLLTSKSFSENFKLEKIIGLNEPWGSSFISKDEIIITEKSGKIKIINLISKKIKNVEHNLNFIEYGQGGLLDILMKKTMFGYLTPKTEEIGKPAHQLLNQNLMIKDYFLKIFFRQNLQ